MIMFQFENDAGNEHVTEGTGKIHIESSVGKDADTAVLSIKENGRRRRFFGLIFFNTTTRIEKYLSGAQTSEKELKGKRQAAKPWLREQLIKPIAITMETLGQQLAGIANYYCVSGEFIRPGPQSSENN